MGQPPRMCAVPGMLKRISVTMLMGVPPIIRATLQANSLAWGMKVGTRLPWLTSTLRNGQNQGRPEAHVDVAVERLHAQQDQRSRAPIRKDAGSARF